MGVKHQRNKKESFNLLVPDPLETSKPEKKSKIKTHKRLKYEHFLFGQDKTVRKWSANMPLTKRQTIKNRDDCYSVQENKSKHTRS